MVFLIPLILIIASVFIFDYMYFSKENENVKIQQKNETKDLKNHKQQYLESILNQDK
ncbi:hypothetical protein CINS5915_00135 [Campylobacter insulaenigrae]|uniref:Uncharacterized protein n=2 Tax=Campylobacter insulaenigrae TaxID=260714 RepID=A0A0A8H4W9_9BACT|nr:SoxR reducing system RseC family protein [Campylobacter insulaenigrae]AJC87939.1 hypothetical protein CINS_0976 [Campylobacter insulaenigrae NCTC 12927]MCR6570278.1 hypothetical protein [Campylobacter insulaenigrae]MCR6571680.1 hypothetical protein [Campylobacter insulaenigrae]MCR6573318.1 hypothetical protein [Campylobacter insulaenigrae]MCR6574783.1 hypothetical protein [Campylobacter insulaenigrae]